MPILEIRKFNDPILRKKAKEVDKITEDIKKIVADMTETMGKNDGIGLAAPQIGVSKRIFLMRKDFEKPDFLGLINPKIIEKSQKKEIWEEGCLSLPGIFLNIKRAEWIKAEGIDINGKKITVELRGIIARVFQHEVDHLDGILIFNRLGFFQKIKFKFKYPKVKI